MRCWSCLQMSFIKFDKSYHVFIFLLSGSFQSPHWSACVLTVAVLLQVFLTKPSATLTSTFQMLTWGNVSELSLTLMNAKCAVGSSPLNVLLRCRCFTTFQSESCLLCWELVVYNPRPGLVELRVFKLCSSLTLVGVDTYILCLLSIIYLT